MHAIGALARCPGNGRASVSGRGPLSEKRETTLVVSLFSGRAPWAPDAHSASPRTRLGPERKRFPPCKGWQNGWGGGCEQGGTGGSGSNAEIAPCPPAKPPGTMGSREGSPPPDTLPRGRVGVAGKAGRGRGAGVSRRGPAPSLTILPSQSGEIRLAANLWIRGDASRRQRRGRGAEGWAGIGRRLAGGGTGTAKRGDSPGGESLDTRRRRSRRQRKMAGSGRNGGYKGKGWREAERVRPSGEIRLAANLWIRGDGGAVASEDRRGAKGLRRDGMRTNKRKGVAGRRNL